MDALYRPTPVRILFRVVQCFRLRSSQLTSSPGSDTWQCTRVGPDVSQSYFHVAASQASFHRSSWMTLASPEVPCCKVYDTWVCMEALHSVACRAGCAIRVSLPSMPRRGWLLSALGQQGLSLLRQWARAQETAWDNQIWSAVRCWLRRQPSSRVGFCSRQGHSIQLQGIPGLARRSIVFRQRLPRLCQQDDGWVRL